MSQISKLVRVEKEKCRYDIEDSMKNSELAQLLNSTRDISKLTETWDHISEIQLKYWYDVMSIEQNDYVSYLGIELREMVAEALMAPVSRILKDQHIEPDGGFYFYGIHRHPEIAIAFSHRMKMHGLFYDAQTDDFKFQSLEVTKITSR